MININNLNTKDLKSIGLSQISKGVLLKWNDKNYYYKSGTFHYGSFSKIQPVIECICSKIRSKLGFYGVDYELQNIKTNGCEDFEAQEILCCKSKNFLGDEESLITFAKHYKNSNEKITYEKLINDFSEFEEFINQTLVFDFIVNNIDRHFNNFGYISNGEVKYCPIFDNGLSLYADLNIEEIKFINKNKYNKKKFDKSKPFLKKHYSQIKLIKNLPQINLENKNEEFFDIIKQYKEILGNERTKAMIDLIDERLSYVRKIYADAQK